MSEELKKLKAQVRLAVDRHCDLNKDCTGCPYEKTPVCINALASDVQRMIRLEETENEENERRIEKTEVESPESGSCSI